jgi:serine/threonine protein kinase
LYGINLLPLEKCRDETYELFEEPILYNEDGSVNAADAIQDNFERLAIIDKDDKEMARVAGQTTKSLNFTVYGPVKDEKEVLLADFNIKKVVGEGAFGKVYLVEKKDTKALYAMKTLAKDMLLEDDRILESTLLEKKIL